MNSSKILNPVSSIVAGLLDGGCNYVSCYPGFHSHDIAKELGQNRICINEKTAYQMCYGANLSGKKAVLTIKGVGLNVCADEYFHSLLSGVFGGMVIILTDDTEVRASQEWQDSRFYQSFYGGLWFEPSSIEEAYNIAINSFDWSCKIDVPIVIRLTSEYFNLSEMKISTRTSRKNISKKNILRKNPKKYIVYPNYWLNQQLNLNKKNKIIQDFVEKYFINKKRKFKIGVDNIYISSGVIKSKSEKISIHDENNLSISTYPIPKKNIKKLIANSEKVIVLENGRNYLKQQISLMKENDLDISDDMVNKLNIPKPSFIVWSHLDKLFKAISDANFGYVVGDVGSYTVESTKTIDSCLCLGSAVGVAVGIAGSGTNYPICITGDAGFAHGGILGYYEGCSLDVSMGIVVIDNGGSWSTGGQKLAIDIYDLAKGNTIVINDYSLVSITKIKNILIKMKKNTGISILFIKINQKNILL